MFKDGLMKGKRILVTGGGTGLGEVMATKYLELGADIIICGRRGGILKDTAKRMMDKHGGRVATYALDIRVPAAIEEVVEEVWQSGPLDGLLNNAAGNFISRSEDLSPRGFDAITNIVLHGTFYMSSAVGRRWIEGGHKGSILNIVATYAWTGSPYVVPSASAKAGVVTMTKSLGVEWAPYGIRVNGIAPGAFPTEGASARLSPQAARREGSQTNDGSRAGNPMGRIGDMEELANLAVFLMADGCDYINGETISITGGGHHGQGSAALRSRTDEEWEEIRNQIKAVNERDKAQRSA